MRFSGFDDEWIEEKLGNLVQIKSGECTKNLITGIDNSIPYFKVEQLNNSLKYQIKTPYFINDKSKIVNKGSIIFPKRGAAILLNKIRILNQDSFMDTNLMTLTPNNKLYNEFLYYFIYKENLSKIADTTSIPQLNNKHIKPYPIKLPSFEEQLKISKFISSVDKKVSLLSQNLEIFNDFKKGLLQQIFTQKLRFDFDEDWYIDKIGNNSEVFGRIGFRGYTVDDLVDKGQGALTIGGKHISKNFQLDLSDPEYLSWEKYEESPEIKIYNGDVLLVKTVSVGKVCFIENLNEPATLNPQLIVFKNIKLNNKFFYYYLTSNLFQKDIHKIKSTTGIPTITQKELLNLNIIYPSLEEQEKIVNFLSIVDKKISSIDKNLKDIKKFKKGLLQQMFVVQLILSLLQNKKHI